MANSDYCKTIALVDGETELVRCRWTVRRGILLVLKITHPRRLVVPRFSLVTSAKRYGSLAIFLATAIHFLWWLSLLYLGPKMIGDTGLTHLPLPLPVLGGEHLESV